MNPNLGNGRGIFEFFPKDFIPLLTFERIYNSRNAHLHNGTKNSHILLGVFLVPGDLERFLL